MMGVYFKTHRLAVIFLIFIAIAATTSFMAIDMKALVSTDKLNLLIMLVLISVGVLRYGGTKRNTKNKISEWLI